MERPKGLQRGRPNHTCARSEEALLERFKSAPKPGDAGLRGAAGEAEEIAEARREREELRAKQKAEEEARRAEEARLKAEREAEEARIAAEKAAKVADEEATIMAAAQGRRSREA